MLSIIIPTLNEEKYLGQLLQSIKKQTFKDYEIIVADAGSKDKTLEIAKRFDCRITKGGLPAVGRNEGAKAAKGSLFLFLDADTKLPNKKFLKAALREFYKRKLGAASCRLIPLESLGKKRLSEARILNLVFDVANSLMSVFEKTAPFGVGSMILVKSELHKKIGGFDEDVRFGEDTLYFRKAAKIGSFGILRSVRIYWSWRRFRKEKWFKPAFLYLVCWFVMLLDKKKLDIFKRGFFEYKFGHYQESKNKAKNQIVNNLLNLKIFEKLFKNKL